MRGATERRAWVRRVRHWVANRGWRGFFAEVLRRLKMRLRGESPVGSVRPEEMKAHPFDVRHGVETSGLIWGERLGSGASGQYWATGYYGISPSVFGQAMSKLELGWARFTFVDVGCGKGRALMLATGYPFRRAVGVELSPELAAVARGNLARFCPDWRLGVPVEVVVGDATRFQLPPGPLLLFLYHPFAAPVMAEFLERMRASIGREHREVYVVYVNPELDRMLAESGSLERLWLESFAMGDEDVDADRFGSKYERVAAYRARS